MSVTCSAFAATSSTSIAASLAAEASSPPASSFAMAALSSLTVIVTWLVALCWSLLRSFNRLISFMSSWNAPALLATSALVSFANSLADSDLAAAARASTKSSSATRRMITDSRAAASKDLTCLRFDSPFLLDVWGLCMMLKICLFSTQVGGGNIERTW
jgi:hypothetical protein